MPKVFISWASPDKAAVDELATRLRGSGVDYWISSRDMRPGEDPVDRVRKEINEAKVAVFLLSDQAADREWIKREVDWCVFAKKIILPAAVASLSDDSVPRLISAVHRADLAQGASHEQNLANFVNDICNALQLPEPILLPCALFAMNAGQFADLQRNDPCWEAIRKMCNVAGIENGKLDELLAKRYGQTDLDFAPFEENKPLKTTVQEALFIANQQRNDTRRKQIHLLWCQDRLVATPPDDSIRDVWVSSNPILIVDSVSLCHPAIRTALMRVPQTDYIGRLSLLWVPPYTRHTETLEGLIEPATREVQLISEGFRRFKGRTLPERWTAFDIGTPASLSDWIYRVGSHQPDEAAPMRFRAAIMRTSLPSGFTDTMEFNQV